MKSLYLQLPVIGSVADNVSCTKRIFIPTSTEELQYALRGHKLLLAFG